MQMNQAADITPFAPAGTAAETDVPLSGVFKALGDPLRLQILRLLKDDSLSVSELCDVVELRQSALSHHLKVLVQADLLVRRREGTAAFYRRQLPAGERAELLARVFENIDAEALPSALKQGLTRVQAQREQNSLMFFRDNSDRFREQKELIASWADYTQAALHLLERCSGRSIQTLLEIGPGDGSLLPALSSRAKQVVALDNSAAMLESAKTTAGDLANVTFELGDTQHMLAQNSRFDVAMANMVLHHTPHPEHVIADAAQLLNPGGCLVISELCAHDQAWAREHCGDLWLGFEPAQLTAWAHDAGLENRAELFIAQRNGFQIQVRLFQRRDPIH